MSNFHPCEHKNVLSFLLIIFNIFVLGLIEMVLLNSQHMFSLSTKKIYVEFTPLIWRLYSDTCTYNFPTMHFLKFLHDSPDWSCRWDQIGLF